MTRTLIIAIATGSLLSLGLPGSGAAVAGEHGQQMNEEHGHHAMGQKHPGSETYKATGADNGFDKKPEVGTKAKCPVTGDEFTVSKDTLFSEYKGKYYAFCCPECKPQFDKNPEKYLK